MRKRLSIVLTALCALFISCGGGLSQEGTGSISMDAGRVAKYLGQHANHSAIVYNKKNGNVVEGLDFIPPIKQEMKVGLSTIGSYTTSTEIVYSQKVTDIDSAAEFEEAMEQFYIECFGKTITLEEIPVGSRIRVKAVLTISELIDEEEFRKKLPSGYTEAEIKELLELAAEAMDTMTYSIEGSSDLFKVHSGSNSVTIRMNLGGDEEEGGTWVNPIFTDDYNHPILLWNGREAENILKYDGSDSLTVDTANSIPYSLGGQLYSHIEEGLSINEASLPIPSSDYSDPVFCFADNNLYWVAGEEIYEINYLTSTKTELGIKEKLKTITEFSNKLAQYDDSMILITSITYYNDSLYFPLQITKSTGFDYGHYFVKWNLNTDNLIYCEINEFYNWKTQFITLINDETYLIKLQSGDVCKIKLTESDTALSLDEDNKVMCNMDFTYKASDIQLMGNTLYIACYVYQDSTDNPSTYLDANGVRYNVISTGGIAKVDLTGDFELSDWSNGEKYLGLYLGNYYYNVGTWEEPVYELNSEKTPMTPPKTQDKKYFYGARKFIARRPDDNILVVADDGVYMDIENPITAESKKVVENKNRVVTVNLLDESISAVDVNVCFNATAVRGTKFGIGD
ncbi:hypothetical protein SAMN04487775_106135 [Treponema bryantii]|uniref:Lipoprotein n=1 Tax=Treponema bryantii TaxID=163 RepID=A0A1I3L9R8_9SPIR|nr:hypothetical protein [Treponema bryantii]SFI81439.1 hypothetical protein SAMN04487775_106135 [Treponema bryantii]